MATWTRNINTALAAAGPQTRHGPQEQPRPGCHHNIPPPTMAVWATQITMSPVTGRPLDTNVTPPQALAWAPSDDRSHKHQLRPSWLLQGPGHTWHLVIAQAQMSPWTWVASWPFMPACSSPPSPPWICPSPSPQTILPLPLFPHSVHTVLSHNGAQLPSTRALGWITGGAWLNTACPKGDMELLPFLFPVPGPRDPGQYLV